MEWAIRAIQRVNSDQYQNLQSIDASIHEFWKENEFIAEETKELELMEFSWDVLQIDKVTSRSYTKVVSPTVHEKLTIGLQEIYKQWKREVSKIRLSPIADDYRYFDLLHGNDIPKLLTKIQSIINALPKYAKDDSIPIKEFALFLRTPRKLNNESLIFHGPWINYEGESIENSLMLVVRTDVKINSFQTILNEFILEYCKKRNEYLKTNSKNEFDDLPNKLITQVLNQEAFGIEDVKINQSNQLIGPFFGLFYWDCAQQNKQISSAEIGQILHSKFNIQRDDSIIRKEYKKTRENIDALIGKALNPKSRL